MSETVAVQMIEAEAAVALQCAGCLTVNGLHSGPSEPMLPKIAGTLGPGGLAPRECVSWQCYQCGSLNPFRQDLVWLKAAGPSGAGATPEGAKG